MVKCLSELSVGSKLYYGYKEFDGSGLVEGTITEKAEDHFILTDGDGLTYWFENDYKPSSNYFLGEDHEEALAWAKRKHCWLDT